MPTPPGNRFAAHAPVVRIHLVDDDDRGSRIFPQDAHKQFRRPLDEFRFLLGGRRAVFPKAFPLWGGKVAPQGRMWGELMDIARVTLILT